MKANESHLITASEIARHMFCARALAYDDAHPQERSQSFFSQLRSAVLSPIRTVLLLLPFAILITATNLRTALLSMLAALVLVLLGRFIWNRIRQSPSLIIYHGTKAVRNQKTLAARNFGLVGKPDYLLAIDDGNFIPVLTKTNPSPETPHEAHIMQVVAHCLVVAESKSCHPPYGVIRYSDGRTFEIDFDEDSVEVLSDVMDEIESNRKKGDVPISHNERRRCYACSHRHRCDQSLF